MDWGYGLSMEFSWQEHWSGLPFPTPGDLPDPGIEPSALASSTLAGRFFTTSTTWEAPLSQKVASAVAAAAAAKLLQSCLTLCDPIDGSPPGSPVPGILQVKVASDALNCTSQKARLHS